MCGDGLRKLDEVWLLEHITLSKSQGLSSVHVSRYLHCAVSPSGTPALVQACQGQVAACLHPCCLPDFHFFPLQHRSISLIVTPLVKFPTPLGPGQPFQLAYYSINDKFKRLAP
jgi:hypothetical protein